ncbi:MAG: hypothetical protein NTU61_06125 [Candidatus Altiarchaeota archaeon]|nr:hypothetical protein [Candidatus Altiarchaeota archaeon]
MAERIKVNVVWASVLLFALLAFLACVFNPHSIESGGAFSDNLIYIVASVVVIAIVIELYKEQVELSVGWIKANLDGMSSRKAAYVVLIILAAFILYQLMVLKPLSMPYKSMVYVIPAAALLLFLFRLREDELDSFWYAALIFAGFTVVYMSPFLVNIDWWGSLDFDYFFTYNLLQYKAIMAGEMPFWNSLMCGGQPLMASPTSMTPSPTLAFLILFGEIVGTKMNLMFHLFAGMLGCFLVARKLGLKGIPSYIPSFVYMMSGAFASNIAIGHYAHMTMAWIPYVMLFYMKSLDNLKYTPLISVFLAIILFEGYPYFLSYAIILVGLYAIALTVERFFSSKRIDFRPIAIALIALLLFLLISAVRLYPMLEYTARNHRSFEAMKEGYTPELFYHGLLDTDQALQRFYLVDGFIFTPFNYMYLSWHEYAAYIGEIAMMLVLIGIALTWKKHAPLLACLLFFVWASFSVYAPVNLWAILTKLPLLENLKEPTRMKVVFVFIMGLYAGYGAEYFNRNKRLLALITAAILLSLMVANMDGFHYSFIVMPMKNENTTEFSTITYDLRNLSDQHIQLKTMASSMYYFTQSGYAVKNCQEPLNPKSYVKAAGEEGYGGEAYLLDGGSAILQYAGPNSFTIKADVNQTTTLVLNQNYYPGWTVNGKPALEYEGLLAADIDESGEYTFRYYPTNFSLYVLLTIAGLILSAALWRTGIAEKIIQKIQH